MRRKKPDLAQATRAYFDFLARTLAELRHLEPRRILVVAGEARRASYATVTPLAFGGAKRRKGQREKPLVKVNGRRMLYCITLRPLFFRASTPRERVGTLLHELLHIAQAFDGIDEDEVAAAGGWVSGKGDAGALGVYHFADDDGALHFVVAEAHALSIGDRFGRV